MYKSNCLKLLFFLIIVAVVYSCKYKKLLNSSNYKLKEKAAIEYFEREKYNKAIPLFEELLSVYRGTLRAEDIYYYLAECHFGLRNYLLANYFFETFASTYASSPRRKDAEFMAAFCTFKGSPKPSLDPTNTYKAIEKLQLFINHYPKSKRIDSCNVLVEMLRAKLENKYFTQAILYFKMDNYRAAVVALENFLLDFPDSEKRAKAQFVMIKSQYLYAENSIDSKQLERYRLALSLYNDFKSEHGDTKFSDNANQLKLKIVDAITATKKRIFENKAKDKYRLLKDRYSKIRLKVNNVYKQKELANLHQDISKFLTTFANSKWVDDAKNLLDDVQRSINKILEEET